MYAKLKKERAALRREFAGRYPLPYAQVLLAKMMEQSLQYRPVSAEEIQVTELFGFYTRLCAWLDAELQQPE